jgi:hypothetical protein
VFTAFSGTTMSAAKHTLMFASIGSTCDACHDLSTLKFYGVTNLTTRPNGHHVGKDCNGCHSPNNWGGNAAKRTAKASSTPTTAARSTVTSVVAAPTTPRISARDVQPRYAGPAVQGAASLGAGKGAGVQRGVGSAAASHMGVIGNCVSCHNGTLAGGKGAAHIVSNNACENCHTTVAWLPARFEHQGVTASCASCHNGAAALGKPARHVPTAQDCATCHGTVTWSAAKFNHVGINSMCQSCHNGTTATGKQLQHAVTTLDCGSCHNTLNWAVPALPPKLQPLLPHPRNTATGPNK